MANHVELVLTCGSWQEAQKIADTLLEKKLIACAEFLEIKSQYWWKDALENANEIRLILLSADHLFDKIEAEVKKLHSYETFTLYSIPISQVSADAKLWLEDNVE